MTRHLNALALIPKYNNCILSQKFLEFEFIWINKQKTHTISALKKYQKVIFKEVPVLC